MKQTILASTLFCLWAAPGVAQWSTDPAQNLQILRGSVYPQMIADGTGGAIFVGVSFTVRPHLYAQRVDQLGKILWSQSLVGIQVSDAGVQQGWLGSSLRHLVIPDGAGGAYIAFHAFWVVGQYPEPPEEIYTYRVYIQHLDADGNLSFGSEGLPVLYRAPADTSGQILEALVADNAGGAYVVLSDFHSLYEAEADWYVDRFASSGTEVWGGPLRLPGISYVADLICYSDGEGGVCIYGRDVEYTPATGWVDRFLRISPSGEVILNREIDISAQHDGLPFEYDLVNENGLTIFVWRESNMLYMQKIDRDGNMLWGTQAVFLDSLSIPSALFFRAPDHQGGIFISHRSASSAVGSKLRNISSAGEIMWEKQIQIIRIASDIHSNLFYLQTAFPSPEKYIQKLNFAGETLWDSTGIVLSTRQWMALTCIISDEAGGAIICWDENVPARGIWAQQVNSDGKLGTTTAVNTRRNNNSISTNRFHPNFPNPFNAATDFSYEITSLSQIELTIYDLLGAPIVTLVNAEQAAGKYKVRWDGRDAQGRAAPSGVYFARFFFQPFEKTRNSPSETSTTSVNQVFLFRSMSFCRLRCLISICLNTSSVDICLLGRKCWSKILISAAERSLYCFSYSIFVMSINSIANITITM